jgi:hypothetical protein
MSERTRALEGRVAEARRHSVVIEGESVPSMLQQIGCAGFEEKTRREPHLSGRFKEIGGPGHWRGVEERGNEVEGQKDLMGVMCSSKCSVRISTGRHSQQDQFVWKQPQNVPGAMERSRR